MSTQNHIINIPSELKSRLNSEHEAIILDSLIPFSQILKENKLYFFPEYTDHGINHIESVLKSIENLIVEETLHKLSSLDVCAIIISTVLHDIGMHTSREMFNNMILGKYDNIPGNLFKNEDTWKELWYQYLKDSRFWTPEKKENVFGNKDHIIKEPNLNDPQSFNEYDQMFIGEFIRIHHPRLAYEIALIGYIGDTASITFDFSNNQDLNNIKFIHVCGLIARSHGMNVRDTFQYLKKISGATLWKQPIDIKVVFLMALIRIADYIQIDASRTNHLNLKLNAIHSPYSLKEHKTHLAIDCIQLNNDDKEKIVVEASPDNAEMYVKIERLIQDIQHEFDLSWAIIGEVYGDDYKMKYRRIVTNITDEEIIEGYDFVPKQFGFKFNSELTKLLIAPLYGNNPSYGVRELVQNAVDACRTRMAIDEEYSKLDITHVTVSVDTTTQLFTIVDTGIGMSIDEIEKYFLTIGSSYNDSTDWKKTQDTNHIYRTGRFGIGILAAFLLGSEIKVKTRSINGNQQGYQFTMSLDKRFVQIDKVYDLEYGTTIEIHETKNYINMFDMNGNWCNWYIDPKPRVEYFLNGKEVIPICNNIFKTFKKLVHTSSDFGDIYWKPQLRLNTVYGQEDNSELYCNGFLITKQSQKKSLKLQGLKAFYDFPIPPLNVTDLHNLLPINLQRNDLESKITYPFEKDLAIAMYKDLLCQLVAIDIKSQTLHPSFLFFNAKGYTYNRCPALPLLHHFNWLYSTDRDTTQFLSDKYIVHFSINQFNLAEWAKLMNNYPDTFFSFFFNDHLKEVSFVYSLINKDFLDNWIICFDSDSTIDDEEEALLEHLRARYSAKTIEDFFIFSKHSSDHLPFLDSFIPSIVNHTDFIPSFFCVKKVHHYRKVQSDLDDFFEEYAGGDMIVPYDEEKRRKKFAKLYNECSEDIERYRQLFNTQKKNRDTSSDSLLVF